MVIFKHKPSRRVVLYHQSHPNHPLHKYYDGNPFHQSRKYLLQGQYPSRTENVDLSGEAILLMGGYAQIWADVFRYRDISRFGPIQTKWEQQKVTKCCDFSGDAILPMGRYKQIWPDTRYDYIKDDKRF